jgi:tripartite-type tricarboxylate transporter receptor subunit TctC
MVPYKSVAEVITALAKGEVDVIITDAASANAHYSTGRLRPLAVTGATRMPGFPNLPTMREEGVPDFEVGGWFATYFPAKMPPEVVATMREIIRKAAKASYLADLLKTYELQTLELSGDELGAFQRAESEKWGKLVRAANMGPK